MYNKLEFFREALDSARHQTTQSAIIVVDNASEHDEFKKIIDELQDDSISYYRNASNLGMEGNWNACIDHSATPYVTILHDDDALHPHFTEHWLQCIEADQQAGVWATSCLIGPDNPFIQPNNTLPREAAKPCGSVIEPSRFAYAGLSPFPGVVFPTATSVRFDPDLHGAADYYFWYELSKTYTTRWANAELAFYRRSQLQASSKMVTTIVNQLFHVRQRIIEEQSLGWPYTLLDRYTRYSTFTTYEQLYQVAYLPADEHVSEVAQLRHEFSHSWRRLLSRSLLKVLNR